MKMIRERRQTNCVVILLTTVFVQFVLEHKDFLLLVYKDI